MTITNESGGRQNAFANEPRIEVINSRPSSYKRFQLLALLGAIALISIIGIYLVI
ncbi:MULTISPECIES: DNA-binding protein [Prochlorococcus]|uniref:HLIP family protein n=1 Tax=Prochlorococcus marinus (strain SARG / CCMP1375 / SS120) TaxID=167539 RepID=Q7V9K8_PROMA|nr:MULTISPECIES: DNA-binding protein [Prochlorococcus]AAQ00869.1 HLIP family protein [Prochlorococcus marinus subsp. marinus str. CCMP1375]KGG10637.1 hypothetical protein EV04_1596 [Prochlorococcus marinus str. LG]KGG19897.1 hypothetical protein EV08_1211 [Prochlorococcus marinus str. SS2]KGG23883.1 hypothetical protein EV09_0485 [Prochlorococcus marinus str. SS35]KGG31857.1 hypothetical protein EV10_1956 [Prochlorococcus marinus str. SS51]